MPHHTFLKFIWPSALASFFYRTTHSLNKHSIFFIEHESVLVVVENCTPSDAKTRVDLEATKVLEEENHWQI